MFSQIKDLRADVKTGDQRTGKEAQDEEQKTQKKACESGRREKIEDEQSAFVARLLSIGKKDGESRVKEKEEQPFPDCQYEEKAEKMENQEEEIQEEGRSSLC